MKNLVLKCIRFYQNYLSFLWGPKVCRFDPSCSQYTYESISKYGILKGTLMGTRQLLHCHPFYHG